VLGLVGLELALDAGHLGGTAAVVTSGLDGVVPGTQVTQQSVGLLLGRHVVHLLLALLHGLLSLVLALLGHLLDLVQKSHGDSLLEARLLVLAVWPTRPGIRDERIGPSGADCWFAGP